MMTYSLDRIKIPADFWRGLSQLNIAVHDVIRKAQLPLTVLNESAFINTAQFFALWQAFSEMVSDPAVCIIELTTGIETAQLPPAVLASYHSRDYRDALIRMARYKQMCVPERFHITEKGELCSIDLEWLYAEQSSAVAYQGKKYLLPLKCGFRMPVMRRRKKRSKNPLNDIVKGISSTRV